MKAACYPCQTVAGEGCLLSLLDCGWWRLPATPTRLYLVKAACYPYQTVAGGGCLLPLSDCSWRRLPAIPYLRYRQSLPYSELCLGTMSSMGYGILWLPMSYG